MDKKKKMFYPNVNLSLKIYQIKSKHEKLVYCAQMGVFFKKLPFFAMKFAAAVWVEMDDFLGVDLDLEFCPFHLREVQSCRASRRLGS